MYTFLILYPYAVVFNNYISKNFTVIYTFNNVKLTKDEVNQLYNLSGYDPRIAKQKVSVNTKHTDGKYRIFLIKGKNLRHILYTKRKLRSTIHLKEQYRVSLVKNMFHSLDTFREKMYMCRILVCHAQLYGVFYNIFSILGIT